MPRTSEHGPVTTRLIAAIARAIRARATRACDPRVERAALQVCRIVS
jgi:hypothetical protein